MFSIELKKYYWIDKGIDYPYDMCLHGDIAVNVGNDYFETDCTISATALRLLKTLTENHIAHENSKMFPCCGHFMIANEENDTLTIIGCPYGVDLTIINKVDSVEISTEHSTTLIDIATYTKTVYTFADMLQSIYEKCSQRYIPKENFEQKGYVTMWNEWTRRRNNYSHNYFCPALSRKSDSDLCAKYCSADDSSYSTIPDYANVKELYQNAEELHDICKLCMHKQKLNDNG